MNAQDMTHNMFCLLLAHESQLCNQYTHCLIIFIVLDAFSE